MDFRSLVTIERLPGNVAGTVILRLTGPLTLAATSLLRAHFRDYELPTMTILDMSRVPYVDSSGMSEIVNHELHCRDKHVRLIVTGLSHRVLGMLKITHLDKVLNLKATVEDAEAS